MSAFFLALKFAFHFVPYVKSSKRKGPLALISSPPPFITFTLPLFCSDSQQFPLGILNDFEQFTKST